MGRPLKFGSVKELEARINDYFKMCNKSGGLSGGKCSYGQYKCNLYNIQPKEQFWMERPARCNYGY